MKGIVFKGYLCEKRIDEKPRYRRSYPRQGRFLRQLGSDPASQHYCVREMETLIVGLSKRWDSSRTEEDKPSADVTTPA